MFALSLIASGLYLFRTVAVARIHEDQLLEKVFKANDHNLLNIPLDDDGEVLQLEIGLVLKGITQVVRQAPLSSASSSSSIYYIQSSKQHTIQYVTKNKPIKSKMTGIACRTSAFQTYCLIIRVDRNSNRTALFSSKV